MFFELNYVALITTALLVIVDCYLLFNILGVYITIKCTTHRLKKKRTAKTYH
jgi:hypothetical protein